MDNIKKFPKFYLRTRQISQMIRSEEELNEALNILLAQGASLFRLCADNSADRLEFGNLSAHKSLTSLFEFLDANGIDISPWLLSRHRAEA